MQRFNIAKPKQDQNISQSQQQSKEILLEDLVSSRAALSEPVIDNNNNNAESGEFTLASLWNSICDKEDIIIVIDRVDEPRVRKQLSSLKAKENAKMKSAGIKPDDTTLEFIEHKDYPEKDKIKLQIILKHKPTIKIHKLIIAKD